jgi:hypothetical protein
MFGSRIALFAVSSLFWSSFSWAFRTPAAPRSARAAQRLHAANGASPEVEVVVGATELHALLPGTLGKHGKFYRNSDDRALAGAAPNQDVSLCVLAGTLAGSGERPVLAFVRHGAAQKVGKGKSVRVPAELVLPRPAALSEAEACMLACYALPLLPALADAGLEHILPEHNLVATAVVTGSTPQALFATQVCPRSRGGVSAVS